MLRPIIARKHPWPDPSAISPPNALLSETARWKRCVPSFIPTAPQKRDRRPPQSLILPKPVSANILPAVMRLGVNLEQLNRKQLLELMSQLITQIEALLRRTRIINLLIWVGLSASPYLWTGAAPVQASASERSAAQSAQESSSLELGKPIQRELSGGQSHSYKITMISGQYLHVVVDQRGIDVAVALFTPDGKKISEVDSEHIVEGSETVSTIAEAPGAYLIEVRSPEKTAKTGRYEIKVEELRAATVEDKYQVAGELIFREAERLQNGTLEAKRKSIEKYHEALEMYRRATDRNGEAQTLSNIGEVYWSLGEMRKALEKYNEALPTLQAVGNHNVAAETLSNIGAVYRSLGENRKALEKYNEALTISRAAGDRRGEAITLNNIGLVYLRPTACSTASALNFPGWSSRLLTRRGDRRTDFYGCTRSTISSSTPIWSCSARAGRDWAKRSRARD